MNTMEMVHFLASDEGFGALVRPYGDQASSQALRYMHLVEQHKAHFGEKPSLKICSAPGRCEIAGNHTDHNNGRVLAAAINLDTIAAVSPNDNNAVTLYSEGYDHPFIVDLSDLSIRPDERETTAALIRGVAARLNELGISVGGFDAVVTSSVLKGSGLSSSAAFEVMLCQIFSALYAADFDVQELARIAQYAENVYFGKPSGLLDQMASAVGGLVAMDFQSSPATVDPIAYDFEARGYRLVVVSAGGDHGNLTDQYAAIPAEMKMVAHALSGTVLRDVDYDVMIEHLPELKRTVPDRAILRAFHFYNENQRVSRLVQALKHNDMPAFLKGIIASGDSSWELLQNLYVPGSANQELALALELSRRLLKDNGAWRIHGGGFAGTILAFVPISELETYTQQLNSVFGANACTPLQVRPIGPYTLG